MELERRRLTNGRYGTNSGSIFQTELDFKNRVVTKSLPGPERSVELEAILKHEASVLTRLGGVVSPNCLFCGTRGLDYVLVTSLLPGHTLREHTSNRVLATKDVLRLGERLANALETVHSAGFVHGDLKPEHVLIDDDFTSLCDFGMAGPPTESMAGRGCTPLYAAPEQLGLIKSPIGVESDLYSVGVILVELLTQRVPWANSKDLSLRLRSDLWVENIPDCIAGVIHRLLRPDPQRRYGSAKGLSADLRELRSVGQLSTLGRHDLRRKPNLSSFVGRDRELGAIIDWLDDNSASIFSISAHSGRGKTRLLEEAASQARNRGMTVLFVRGRMLSHGTGAPLCHELAGGLKESFLAHPFQMQEMALELGFWSKVLARAFSPLRGLTTESYNFQPQTTALVDAWTALLKQLATRNDFLLILDDLQWADPFTLEWLSRGDACGAKILTAFRTEESARLISVPSLLDQAFELGALSQQSSRDLVLSMTGPLPPSVLEMLTARAGGDPFLLQSLVWGAYEMKAITPTEEGWTWTGEALQASLEGGVVLTNRLDLLNSEGRKLLRAAAVLGKEFVLDQAFFVAEFSEDSSNDACHECRERQFLWGEGGEAGFTHDKIREAVLAETSGKEVRGLHARAAEWLLLHSPTADRELALHLAGAGRDREALEHAKRGVRAAATQLDFPTVESLQKLIVESTSRLGLSRERVRGYLELGRSLSRRASYGEALEYLREGLNSASDPDELLDLRIELSFALVKSSRLEEARPLADLCFESLGIKLPSSPAIRYLRAGMAWKKVLSWLEQEPLAAPNRYDRRAEAAGRLFRLTTEMGSMSADKSLLLYYTLYGCLYSAAHPSPSGSICVSLLGLFSVALGQIETGERLFRRAKKMAADKPEYLNEVLGQSSFAAIARGHLSRALELHQQNIELSSLQGDLWNRTTSQCFSAELLLLQGAFQDAASYARKALNSPDTDETSKLTASRVLCLAGRGHEVSKRPEWSDKTRANRLVCLAQQALGLHELFLGNLANAIEALRVASEKFEQGVFFIGAPSASWLATAYRVRGESRPPEEQAAARTDFRLAQRAAHKAAKDTKRWIVCQPHALREYALASAHAGRFHLARSAFERASELSERIGMRFESAWTLYERGRFARIAGWDDWLDDQAEGLARIRELGGWLPGVDLADNQSSMNFAGLDRFDRVLKAGRRLVAMNSERQVLESLSEEARTLLRCERVRVLDPEDELEGLSQTLVEHCRQARRAVTEAEIEDPTQSLLLHEARSTLMAPVISDQKTVATLVAWQRSLGGFFGEEELRLADYLCALAGAGLDNARVLRERDRTFQSLKASEQRFREFFQYAGVGTALLDEDGTTLEENDYLKTLLSGPTAGKKPWEYCHSEDRQTLSLGFRSVSERKVLRYDAEIRLHRTGGEVAWTQACLVKLPTEQHAQKRYLFTVADTTHRRVAEVMRFLENERRSLAAEVHDSLSQNMTALHFLLAQFEDTDPRLVKAKSLAAQLTADTSNLIASLRNPLSEGTDLLSAIENLVSSLSSTHHIEVQVDWPRDLPKLSELGSATLYRVLQEGLVNIGKHSRASLVRLNFSLSAGVLKVTLSDNGVGFDAKRWLERRGVKIHFGLLSMKDRVEIVGGHFEITSEPSVGTTLAIGLKALNECLTDVH